MVAINEDVSFKLWEINTDHLIDKSEWNLIMKMLMDSSVKKTLIWKIHSDKRIQSQTKESFENSLIDIIANGKQDSDSIIIVQCYGALFMWKEISSLQWGKLCPNSESLIKEIKKIFKTQKKELSKDVQATKVIALYQNILRSNQDLLNDINKERRESITLLTKIHDVLSSDRVSDSYTKTHSQIMDTTNKAFAQFIQNLQKLGIENLSPDTKKQVTELIKTYSKVTWTKFEDLSSLTILKNSVTNIAWSEHWTNLLEASKWFGKWLYDSTVWFVTFVYDMFDDENVREWFLVAMWDLWSYLKANYKNPWVIMQRIISWINSEIEKIQRLPKEKQAHLVWEIMWNVVWSVIGVKWMSKLKNLSTFKVVMKSQVAWEAISWARVIDRLRYVKSWDDLLSYCSKVDRVRFSKMNWEMFSEIIADIRNWNVSRIKELPKITWLKEKVLELVKYWETLPSSIVEKWFYKIADSTRSALQKTGKVYWTVLEKMPLELSVKIDDVLNWFVKYSWTSVWMVDKLVWELYDVVWKSLWKVSDVVSVKIELIKDTIKSIDFPNKAEFLVFLDTIWELSEKAIDVLNKPILWTEKSAKLHFQWWMAIVEKDWKYGFKSSNGKLTVPCEYEALEWFIDWKAIATKNSKKVLINKSWQNLFEIHPCKGLTGSSFDKITPLWKWIYVVEDNMNIDIIRIVEKKWKYWTIAVEWIEKVSFLETSWFKTLWDWYTMIQNNWKIAIINSSAEAVIPYAELDSVAYHGNGIFELVKSDSKMLVSADSKIMIKDFDRVSQVVWDSLVIERWGKKFLYDNKSRIFTKTWMNFESISYLDKKNWVAVIQNADKTFEMISFDAKWFKKIKKIDISNFHFTKWDIAVVTKNWKVGFAKIWKDWLWEMIETSYHTIEDKWWAIIGYNRDWKVHILDIKETRTKKLVMSKLSELDTVSKFHNWRAVATKNGEYWIVDSKWRTISWAWFWEYDKIYLPWQDFLWLQEWLLKVRNWNKYWIIDFDWNVILEVENEKMRTLQQWVIKYTKNDKVWAISTDGSILLEAKYTNVKQWSNWLINWEINWVAVEKVNPKIRLNGTSVLRKRDMAALTVVQENVSITKRNAEMTNTLIDRESNQIWRLLMHDLNYTQILQLWSQVSSTFLQNFESVLIRALDLVRSSGLNITKLQKKLEKFMAKLYDKELPLLKEHLKKQFNITKFSKADLEFLAWFKSKFREDTANSINQIVNGWKLQAELWDSKFFEKIAKPSMEEREHLFAFIE